MKREGSERAVGREEGERKSARRFLWDAGMLLLFLYRERRGDKCLIEALWRAGGWGGCVVVVKGSGQRARAG